MHGSRATIRTCGRWFTTAPRASTRSASFRRPFLEPGLRRVMAEERPYLVVSVLPGVNVDCLPRGVRRSRRSVRGRASSTGTSCIGSGSRSASLYYTAPTALARRGLHPFRRAQLGYRHRRYSRPAEVRGRCRPRDKVREEKCLTELGLDPMRFTQLATVRAEGSPRALKNIAHSPRSIENFRYWWSAAATPSFGSTSSRSRPRTPLLAVGFNENVAELMRAADVLVTKAGGLTLAEAFCCGVPIVVHDALGQRGR